MAITYAFLKVLQGEKPYLDKMGRSPREQIKFLLKGDNMKGNYLGACLDSCRWGGQTTVMYEMDIKKMIFFIQNWMQQNENNFQNLFHERKIEELYAKFELPYIDHKVCPRDKEHKEVIKDLSGRLRCANREVIRFKPSFIKFWDSFDELAQMKKKNYYEEPPSDPIPEDAWYEQTGKLDLIWEDEYEEYQRMSDLFDQERPTLRVIDLCYVILSEKGLILPLETILKRLNKSPEFITVHCGGYLEIGPCKRLDELNPTIRLFYKENDICPGHNLPNNKIVFPFDGWDLAFYVQKWWEQVRDGQTPLFEKF